MSTDPNKIQVLYRCKRKNIKRKIVCHHLKNNSKLQTHPYSNNSINILIVFQLMMKLIQVRALKPIKTHNHEFYSSFS